MWNNFDMMSGISLLPYSDHTYQQAPYQEITQEKYEELSGAMPTFDWAEMAAFEGASDSTLGSQELACAGGACELP
jgi:ribonucleoside-diphosphate reductase alpha chain